MRVAFTYWSRDTAIAAGFLEQKDDQRSLRWFWWALFVVGAVLPTRPGESTVVFLGAFGLLGAWLVSAPQFIGAITDIDLAPVIPRVPALWQRLTGVAAKHDPTVPELAKSDVQKLATEAPVLARDVAGAALLPYATGVAIDVALGLIIALLGLMVGPLLQPIRFGYWSPVSVLYGAILPIVVMAVFTLVAVIAGRALIASLAANQRVEAAMDSVNESGPSTPPLPKAPTRRAKKPSGG